MNKKINIIAAIGLLIGIIFGQLGMFLHDWSILLYEISSVGLIVATTLLSLKFLREEKDMTTAGFIVLTLGEAVMSGGNALGEIGGMAAFGAGLAMYVPSFWLLGFGTGIPKWTRFTIVAASVPFLIAATQIFIGKEVTPASPFVGAGYAFLTISTIGWVIFLFREKARE